MSGVCVAQFSFFGLFLSLKTSVTRYTGWLYQLPVIECKKYVKIHIFWIFFNFLFSINLIITSDLLSVSKNETFDTKYDGVMNNKSPFGSGVGLIRCALGPIGSAEGPIACAEGPIVCAEGPIGCAEGQIRCI